MRMDKLTSRFQQALADAQSLAVGRDHVRHQLRAGGARLRNDGSFGGLK